MAIWRYSAVRATAPPDISVPPGCAPYGAMSQPLIRGEVAGSTAAEVRASLRRIGLHVIELRSAGPSIAFSVGAHRLRPLVASCRELWISNLRRRRGAAVGEWCDALATLLGAGVPLLEALDTLSGSSGCPRSMRLMLVGLCDQLRGGSSLAGAMARERGWFDETAIAIVRAGQHGGELEPVLRRLSERHERADRLHHRLLTALSYPAIVALVGVGVVVFLSTRTLPGLAKILTDGGVEVPTLTRGVMSVGLTVARGWPVMIAVAALLLALALVRRAWGRPGAVKDPARSRRGWSPRLVRQIAVAELARRLAELTASGIPLVEALRVAGPTTRLTALKETVARTADRLERGEDVGGAFDDPRWFDPEFRRLLTIGQDAGDLDQLLLRIAERMTRRAGRLIDRAAALLEPAVILLLAALVGAVVMAAILPLVRLQEILR